jgi:hypothetical protein
MMSCKFVGWRAAAGSDGLDNMQEKEQTELLYLRLALPEQPGALHCRLSILVQPIFTICAKVVIHTAHPRLLLPIGPFHFSLSFDIFPFL